MSEYGKIEDAVVAALAVLEVGGQTLLKTVDAGMYADRRGVLALLTPLEKPAAHVAVRERARRSHGDGVPPVPRLTVLLATQGLRGEDAARRGDVDTRGLFELAAMVSAALDGSTLAGRYAAVLDSEQVVAAGEQSAVIEQQYALAVRLAQGPPTYDGAALAGEDVAVSLSGSEGRSAAFGFPGIDGAFRVGRGLAPRVVLWSGWLRAADDAALSALEDAIEALVGDGVGRVLTDGAGRTFANCEVKAFERMGSRQTHPTTGAVAQAFELRFVQAVRP